MGDEAIHKAAAIAGAPFSASPSPPAPAHSAGLTLNHTTIAILLILAVMIRARALFPRGTLISQNTTPRDRRRRLNTPVNLVPLSGTHLQQVNSGREDVQLHGCQLAHHVRPVHSVPSLRPPPPAYPAHHLDARFDIVGYGYYSIGNSGGAVDLVPPPYTADPSGDGQPL
ncbi:hypothetical protein FRC04_006459 [Tulasnella sp. 424]|nr:hypothetical protein FRC04_006459 [Tulasnella sp. 424]KAG8980504.1 hypothetical protein FRC05_006137 [Tulasnella sp. 425]